MEEEIESREMQWDKPYYAWQGKRFIPLIQDASLSLQKEFNAVRISLDGHLQADLDWKKERQLAKEYIEQGYALLWEMDLGLFSSLPFPLTNQTQFLSLTLSLEHFRDSIWKEFRSHTLGVSLYRGAADFSLQFPWTDEQQQNLRGWLQDKFNSEKEFESEMQIPCASFSTLNSSVLQQSEKGRELVSLFCRDVAVEYLALLASRMPDSLACYLLVDASSIPSLIWQIQALHPERFERFGLAIKGTDLSFQALGWDRGTSYGFLSTTPLDVPQELKDSIGVCLPSMDLVRPSVYEGLEEALKVLIRQGRPFRLIPESYLITEWDGLDYLLYLPQGLSPQGKRKLQGFCAAGGTAVSLGSKLGLAQEMTWTEFNHP
jgi:hypothetical protein